MKIKTSELEIEIFLKLFIFKTINFLFLKLFIGQCKYRYIKIDINIINI